MILTSFQIKILILFNPINRLRKLPKSLAAGIGATLLLLAIAFLDGAQINAYTKGWSLDGLVKLFPYEKYYPENSQALVFVAIDDESLEKLGQWPWPRQTIAKITENMAKSGVAAAGLDILFIEQDRYTPRQLSNLLNIPESRLLNAGAFNGDEKLAQVLSQTPTAISFALSGSAAINPKTQFPNRFISIGDASAGLLEAPELIMPLPVLSKANGAGFVNTYQDDGLVRNTPLLAVHGDTILPALNLEMLRLAVGAKNYILKTSDSGHELLLKVGDAVLNTELNGTLQLHHGYTSRFMRIPAYRLAEGTVPELEGKIAVMGVNALALGDMHSTALEDSIPGALMHLQAIDQLLSGRFLTSNQVFDHLIFLICAALSILSAYLITRISLIYAIGLVAAGGAALVGISFFAFVQYGFLFNAPLGFAILLSGGLVTYIFKSIFEEALRKKMQASFAQYVPADVVQRISRSDHLPSLGGEIVDASVLFLDLRGFTSLTEKLQDEPELMVSTIGVIMNEVTERLIASGATIDKYIGDAVMAFWNAPERQPDHFARALYAACTIAQDAPQIRAKIHALDKRLEQIDIAFGIGIASGPVTVGNMGSTFRFNYTVLGDVVNTASRLESMTKEKGVPILATRLGQEKHLPNQLSFNDQVMQLTSMGDVEVRGKQDVVEIFSIHLSK